MYKIRSGEDPVPDVYPTLTFGQFYQIEIGAFDLPGILLIKGTEFEFLEPPFTLDKLSQWVFQKVFSDLTAP